MTVLGQSAYFPPVQRDTSLPQVKVWETLGNNVWAMAGDIVEYESLDYEVRFLDAGSWEMTMPYTTAALNLEPGRIVTIDWRGKRTTWRVEEFNPTHTASDGFTKLTVGGSSALSLLGRELAWPDPTKALGNQPEPPVPYTGNAETVIRGLINDNYIVRRGDQLSLRPNGNQGADSRARPRFDNLLELAVKKARVGGIGFDVVMAAPAGTRGALELRVWSPENLTRSVQLSVKVGTVSDWSQTNNAPTMTKAVVVSPIVGVDPVVVTTPESLAAAEEWNGHVVGYVSGAQSYDAADQTQAGLEALKDGTTPPNVSLTATDSAGLMAFRDFNVGDDVSAVIETGLEIQDTITSIGVKVGDSGYPEVTPAFGDPNATSSDPMFTLAAVIAAQTRRIRQLERRP